MRATGYGLAIRRKLMRSTSLQWASFGHTRCNGKATLRRPPLLLRFDLRPGLALRGALSVGVIALLAGHFKMLRDLRKRRHSKGMPPSLDIAEGLPVNAEQFGKAFLGEAGA